MNFLQLSLQKMFEGLNGNRRFPYNARIRLKLVVKKIHFVMHGYVDIVLIRCMMGQFCRMLHGKGGVPGKVLTRSNKSIALYCKNYCKTLQMTQSGVSCSRRMHMQLTNTNQKADGIPNGLPRQDVLVFQCASGLLTLTDTLKQCQLGSQVELSRSRTS
jgi:hypothetical protein